MRHKLSIISTLISIITLTCKMNLKNIEELEQAIKTIKDAKQIALKSQEIKANTELDIQIKTIEAEAELEAQKIAKEEEAAEENIKQALVNLRQIKLNDINQAIEQIRLTIKQQQEETTREENIVIKQNIINQLRLKILDKQALLNIYRDINWPEPDDHFKMTDKITNDRPFNYISYNKEDALNKNVNLADDHNSNNRRKIYLLFKYNRQNIQEYGDILHLLININYKSIAQNIISAIIDQSKYYYEIVILTLYDKQANLHLLNIEQLSALQKIFGDLEKQNQDFEGYLNKIRFDYYKNELQNFKISVITHTLQLLDINVVVRDLVQTFKTILDEI
ncbi:virulence associated lipoprotein [Borrelia crocidurae]|uniref:Viral A-type inclusion protein repeat containing protein n=1 Tax=Borrelia crocidurae (strain Achema) TaxID=1155096 RepID=I0FE15_BORCA|nr:virulence associated lipoprotein [Borrelia crocidurae]AFI31721.1 Viral A-type inclusion protein repeat containing protein [Borrelia crocidurae str. Achema]